MVDSVEIITRFYDLHEKPSIIAKELKVNPSYVTKIIQKDSRYIKEKEIRTTISKEKRKKDKCEWIRNKRNNEYNKQLDEYVKMQHIQANKELSYSNEISDLSFAKWNRSAYNYDKNSSDLILNKRLKCSFDISKRVSNIIHPNFIKSTI